MRNGTSTTGAAGAESDEPTDSDAPATREPPQRSSVAATVVAPPVASNWIAGMLLFACFWLPHITGCDNSILRPAEMAEEMVDEGKYLAAVAWFWPHLFGLSTALAVPVILALGRERSDRMLALAIATFWILVWLALLCQPMLEKNQPPEWEMVLVLLPVWILPTAWSAMALYRRDYITSGTRLSAATALLGIVWTYMRYLFHQDVHYGLFLTYLSLLALGITPWFVRARWQQMYRGADAPKHAIRFRLLHVLTAMTIFAILYAYYRFVPELADR